MQASSYCITYAPSFHAWKIGLLVIELPTRILTSLNQPVGLQLIQNSAKIIPDNTKILRPDRRTIDHSHVGCLH